MSEFTSFAIHMAVVYMHCLLAWRFFPERKDNFTVYVFWLMMVLSVLLHSSYGLAYLLMILEGYQWIEAVVLTGYWLLAFLPALLATLFLGELTVKPAANHVLNRALALISSNTKRLFTVCIGLSVSTVIISGLDILSQQTPFYQFGNVYSLALVCGFGLIWLLMLSLGFRPEKQQKSVLNPVFRWLMALLIPVFISVYLFDFGKFWFLVPVLNTVGFSLCFCWSRFRTQFMDVILNQFIRILMAIVATLGVAGLWQKTQGLDADNQKLMILCFIIALTVVYQWLSTKLAGLWHPPQERLSRIHSELPALLANCQTSQSAKTLTESYLSGLFNAQISLNRPLDNPVQTLNLPGAVVVEIQLGYLRRWMPWFSQALYWVKTAGLHLQSHLITLQSLEQAHQQKLKTQTLTALAAKAELSAMRAQIRPHFLFNILNSIHCFISTDPKMAEKTVEILSDIMRSVLMLSDKDTVPLRQEMHVVKQYLEIEKIRYGEQFDYQMTVDPNCHDILVPPFSVQPLVENAIKHGVDAQFEPVMIGVKAKCEAHQLLIKVLDDGPGPAEVASSSGLGMATDNIKNRLEILYGERSGITLKNRDPKGAIAIINIPLEDKNE